MLACPEPFDSSRFAGLAQGSTLSGRIPLCGMSESKGAMERAQGVSNRASTLPMRGRVAWSWLLADERTLQERQPAGHSETL